MKYKVSISPDGKDEFLNYLQGASEFGQGTINTLLDAYDSCIDILEKTPNAGNGDLAYLPKKYRAIHLFKHYWMIYQIYEDNHEVIIEYVVDDRQNYVSFIH